MVEKAEIHQTTTVNVTFRAVLLGLLLIPVNTYFIMANHLKFWSTLPTTMALIYNVVITLMVLMTFNFLLKRFLPRFALKQQELLTVFVMLSISSAISGHDMMQTVVPTVPDGFWFATPENEWKALFWRYIPSWLTTNDFSGLEAFYAGESTFYTEVHIRAWLRPIFWWTVFLTTLIWVMICLNILVRRQWIERERLAYPIVQLPLEMTRPDGRLFRSKMMWLGFAIAGGINLINGLHFFFPALPELPVRHAEIGQYFTQKPYNAIGWTPVYIRSFAVGLAFLTPLEMSFSLWFFYWFWKGERVLGSALGLTALPDFPYDWSQVMGGYLALVCFALYGGRRYFFSICQDIFSFQRRHSGSGTQAEPSVEIGVDNTHRLSEVKEPIPYRWAFVGLIGGSIVLLIFSYKGGMALWTVGLYFLIYYLLGMSITRVRAEVGPPMNRVRSTPHEFLINLFGTRRLSPGSLTMMRFYFTFNRGSRAHPMPHTLEGLKIAEESKMNSGRLVVAMMLATVMGILAAFWAYLVVGYKIGVVSGLGTGGYNLLQSWLYHPTDTDIPGVAFTGFGFCFTGFLWWLRTRFPLLPFHPAGYLLSVERYTMGRLWFSIFIAWAIKTMLLKAGGIRLYRKAFPLFLGLILGEFIIGGAWVIIRLLWDTEVYSFYR